MSITNPSRRMTVVLITTVTLVMAGAASGVEPSTTGPTDDDLEALRRAAEAEATAIELAEPVAPASPAVGAVNLNRLNPEISAIIDVAGLYILESPYVLAEARSGFSFRELEVDFRSALDPYSRLRVQIAAGHEGVEVEEGYFAWSGLVNGVTLTVGRFRQSVGTINRWHAHAWDQTDLPLALRGLIGEEGLTQTGLRTSILLPWFAYFSPSIDLELTNSESEELFAGEFFALPSGLARLGFHVALGEVGYAELGGGGIHGYHNQTIVPDQEGEPVVRQERAATTLGFGELNVAYDPPGGSDRFRVFLRAQGLYLWRQEGGGVTNRLGAFAYVNAHLNRSWEIGLRWDFLSKEAAQGMRRRRLRRGTTGWSPYISWWQSEFVRARLQYRVEGENMTGHELSHLIIVQLVGAIGPHRHERY